MTIKDEVKCTIAGDITAGSICAHTNIEKPISLTFKETLEMLQAQQARHCIPVDGLNVCKEDQSTGTAIDLPARGSAIFVQPDDDSEKKIELETLCRMAGKSCKYEVIQ